MEISDRRGLVQLLSSLPASSVKCVFAERVNDALASAELLATGLTQPKLIVLAWDSPPRADVALSEIVEKLASAALATWPHCDRATASDKTNAPSISETWRAQAQKLAESGLPPLPSGFSNVVAVRNLASMIDREAIVIVLIVEDTSPTLSRKPHLDGLCRVAQWLAEHSGARVCLLVDQSLSESSELASIDFDGAEGGRTQAATSAAMGQLGRC